MIERDVEIVNEENGGRIVIIRNILFKGRRNIEYGTGSARIDRDCYRKTIQR